MMDDVNKTKLFEHFLVVGVSHEKAVEVSKNMELNNQSFTTKMMRRFGDFVSKRNANSNNNSPMKGDDDFDIRSSNNGSEKNSNSVTKSKNDLERFSTTTDSSCGEDLSENMDTTTPSKSKSFHSVFSMFRSSTKVQKRPKSMKSTTSSSVHKSKKDKIYSELVEPTILYHYPLLNEIPPNELCDFCMPMGCRLSHIFNDENRLHEIFYGHKQSTRSTRSFTFLLENNANDKGSYERLYGFCVIHSRYLNIININNNQNNSSSSDVKQLASTSHDFEVPVCYAFISKFPFHDFFFQILYDIINTERLTRVEMMGEMMSFNSNCLSPCNNSSISNSNNSNNNYGSNNGFFHLDRQLYIYVQRSLLEEVLDNLIKSDIPKPNELLTFQVSCQVDPIQYTRKYDEIHNSNSFDVVNNMDNKDIKNNLCGVFSITRNEYMLNSSDWSLPVLIEWLSPDSLVWLISLVLIEAKIIVLGSDVGLVSCSVNGLLSLISPLKWVSPLIPILPMKHIEFVESPVPLIAGLVTDIYTEHITHENILEQCNDKENGTVTAVLDVASKKIFISSSNLKMVQDSVIPNYDLLLKEIKSMKDTPCSKLEPNFNVTLCRLNAAKTLRSIFQTKILELMELSANFEKVYDNDERDEISVRQSFSENENSRDNLNTRDRNNSNQSSGAVQKAINIQIKSLKWSEIGGVILGDSQQSSQQSSLWITNQLNSLSNNVSNMSVSNLSLQSDSNKSPKHFELSFDDSTDANYKNRNRTSTDKEEDVVVVVKRNESIEKIRFSGRQSIENSNNSNTTQENNNHNKNSTEKTSSKTAAIITSLSLEEDDVNYNTSFHESSLSLWRRDIDESIGLTFEHLKGSHSFIPKFISTQVKNYLII